MVYKLSLITLTQMHRPEVDIYHLS